MAGALSRRNLFKIGGGVAAAGVGVSLTTHALAEEAGAAAAWQSELVRFGADGKLTYTAEPKSGKKIPDFSWAGYRNGEEAIPDVPVVKRIGPLVGVDNTAHLQAAIDEVGAMPLRENGFRGALLLERGVYEVATTVFIEHTGVVLRGSSRDGDTGTIIRSTATAGTEAEVGGVECPLWIGGRNGGVKNDYGWEKRAEGTTTDVVSDFVPAGSRRLALATTAPFKVGDNIIIWHRCSQEWLDAIDGGGGVPWEPGDQPIMYNRYVKAIEENADVIVIDAPVFNDLDRSLAATIVYVWDQEGLVRNVGVENLRVDMGNPADKDEHHADSCIAVVRAEDAWVRGVATLHFKHAGVVVRRSTRVTVQDVRAREPRSLIDGRRRYHFNAGHMAQLVLFENLTATEARHAFVSGGQAASSGLNLHNRETAGEDSKQGWSSVDSVLWNCTVDNGRTACIQRPPTSQNFAIGTTGTADGENWYPGNPIGYIEGTNVPGLEPASLYRAQLAERLRMNLIDT